MGRIYLIRHGAPEMDLSQGPVCLGSGTDPHLSAEGVRQAGRLAVWLEGRVSAVYSSPLARCVETARETCEPQVVRGLEEIGMGEWEGHRFSELKELYPDVYERRGLDITVQPPGGEDVFDALTRFKQALLSIADAGRGIAVVAHAGVNKLLLAELYDLPFESYWDIDQPYACVNTLEYDGEALRALSRALTPARVPSSDECQALLRDAGTPKDVMLHCAAVRDLAVEIAKTLDRAGRILDLPLISAAALLHDMLRASKEHAALAAKRLSDMGYSELAGVIAVHHDLPLGCERVCEAAVVYYADKLVLGTQSVKVTERFAASEARCTTPGAREEHARRLAQALRVEEIIRHASRTG